MSSYENHRLLFNSGNSVWVGRIFNLRAICSSSNVIIGWWELFPHNGVRKRHEQGQEDHPGEEREVCPKGDFFAMKTECPEVLFLCVKPRFTGRIPPKGLVLCKLRCPYAGSKCILGWKILFGPHPEGCSCCLSHKYLLPTNISRSCKQILLLCGWLKN